MADRDLEFKQLGGDHQGEVFSKFNSFCNQLKNVLNVSVSNDPDLLIDINKSEEGLEVESPPGAMFQFTGIPYPSDDGLEVQKLHIGAVFEQTIVGRETDDGIVYQTSKSTMRVVYLKVLDGRNPSTGLFPAEIKNGYHFDFEFPPDDGHPIFHVQYDPESIELDVLEQQYAIQNEEIVDIEVLDSPRIPSAPVDVGGLTYMLTKELPEEVEWPGKLAGELEKLPKYPDECYEPEPQSNQCMLPEWWYVHASENSNLSRKTVATRTTNSFSNSI
ncbi:hypothetical protein C453_17219 [Haloferax elongans ATCC BAA-1513]|uniref:Uncharacterized protein n=1 Tax=Haloferax elongans ATCC BAA-1513 TaxID=1230453 RepID=M0HD88_HALEO|nr:hypothetical protein [Haloferax elongans]ELZ81778.1 hypothetical protein C453_17219 [Haloferax elongans ATCC BAA-1513]